MVSKQRELAIRLLMGITLLGAPLAACDSSEEFNSPGESGTIFIDIAPEGIDAPWELETPLNTKVSGVGDSTLSDQVPGEYDISYGDVEGYGSPGPDSRVLEAGGNLRFEESYIARATPTGTVRVDVDPDSLDPAWTLVPPSRDLIKGEGDSTLSKLAIGDYHIWWAPEEGWASPPGVFYEGILVAEDTLTFSGTYEPIDGPQGTVIIRPLPAELDASWVLTGPSRFSASESGEQRMAGREVGEYTIEWQDAPGYRSPEPSSGNLAENDSLTFEATYEVAYGTISIDVTPDILDAPWTLTNDYQEEYSGSGDSTLTNMRSAAYVLTWGAVDGWLEPEPNPSSFVLDDGEQQDIPGEYQKETGTVIVSVSPDEATWTLTGPDLSEARAGDARFEGATPGEYQVTWLPVDGYATPEPTVVKKELIGSETLTFSASHALPGDPNITDINTTGEHGSPVVIRGSNFGSHSLDIEWTGQRIEDTPSGVNPNTWQDWFHRQGTGSSELNHVTTERAWSGSKSLDLTVDQDTHCDGGPCASRLSYPIGNWDKIYITYWFRLHGVSSRSDHISSKHMWLTCNTCDSGAPPFGNNRNAFKHTGDVGLNGQSTFWEGIVNSLMTCSGLTDPWSWPPWYNAEGVGYEFNSTIDQSASQNNRGEQTHQRKFSYQEDEWVRLIYYYDRGDLDVYNGEAYNATFRPDGQGTLEPGLHIGKWASNVLLKSARPGCAEYDEPDLFGLYLFTDNPPGEINDAHTRYWIDDIYIQKGTRARVELGNRPNYADCTQLEIQNPETWSDTEIEVTLNYGGGFKPGDTAYLFVINENEWDNGNLDAFGNGSYDFSGVSSGIRLVLGQPQ